ncbi:uncharacterized protein METZ01_LOCUS27675 [marine metagenome]|uniref:Uncharacterized protein n=1 Tax=marine metagenome TaxID=408172 RepID=A0A381Q656_9ZZZZ
MTVATEHVLYFVATIVLLTLKSDRTTKRSLRSTRKSRFVRRQRTLIFSSAQRLDRSGWDELFWRYAAYRDIHGSLSDLTNLGASTP